jgi:hypothetical protein
MEISRKKAFFTRLFYIINTYYPEKQVKTGFKHARGQGKAFPRWRGMAQMAAGEPRRVE